MPYATKRFYSGTRYAAPSSKRGRYVSSSKRLPLSSTLRRRRTLGARRPYATGISGIRKISATIPGREVPLYIAPRQYYGREAHVVTTTPAKFLAGVPGTGVVTLLNAVDQGVALDERGGTRLGMHQLQVRGIFEASTSTPWQALTWMIVYDRDPLGSLPALTDIVDSPGSIVSFQKLDNRDRFSILHKSFLTMEAGVSASATSDSIRHVDMSINLGNLQTSFASGVTSGAIANMKHGALYFVCVGENATAAYNPSVTLGFRLTFSP